MSDPQNRGPRRHLLFAVAYLACCIVIVLATPWFLQKVDATYPTLFNHLGPEEQPGPMGDPAISDVAIAFDYLGFVFLVVPVAYACRVLWGYAVVLSLFHEVIIFGLGATLVSVGVI